MQLWSEVYINVLSSFSISTVSAHGDVKLDSDAGVPPVCMAGLSLCGSQVVPEHVNQFPFI